jgi:hypothetical protein
MNDLMRDGSRATPLRWWSAQQLDAVAARLAPLWAAWLSDWRPASVRGEPRVACRLAWELRTDAERQWSGLGKGLNGSAWTRTAEERAGNVHEALFGAAGRSSRAPLSRALAAEAAADLEGRLRAELGTPTRAVGAPLPLQLRPWSGAVVVSLTVEASVVFELLLDGDLAASRVPSVASSPAPTAAAPLPTLVPADAACRAQQVRVDIRLAGCELDLGTLAGIRVGDIIPMTHSLESPLQMVVEGRTLGSGFLGRHGNVKAIELAQHQANTETL